MASRRLLGAERFNFLAGWVGGAVSLDTVMMVSKFGFKLTGRVGARLNAVGWPQLSRPFHLSVDG